MGLVKIQNGNIYLLGHSVVANGKISPILRDIRPRIGYVPEYLEIYPFLNVGEYLKFISKLFALTEQEYEIYSDYLIKLFDLGMWEETPIKNLSTGNYQKLILCTALIHQPELLILDEPFSNLDIRIRKKTKLLLNKFVREGIPELDINSPGSIIISSHILPDLEELCTQVAILYSGTAVWKGSIDKMKKIRAKARSLESFILETWGYETEKDQ